MKYSLLSEAMPALVAAQKVANDSLDLIPFQAMAGAEARKNAAIQECLEIANEIRSLVNMDTAAIFTDGPAEHQKLFAELAADDAGAVIVSANDLYKELTRLVTPFVQGRLFNFDSGLALMAALRQVAGYLNIVHFAAPNFAPMVGLKYETDDELQGAIKKTIRDTLGDDLNAVYIAYKVYQKVMQANIDRAVVAAVITDAYPLDPNSELIAKLFGGRCVTVDVAKKPTKNDFVAVAKKLQPLYTRSMHLVQKMRMEKARAARGKGGVDDSEDSATVVDKEEAD